MLIIEKGENRYSYKSPNQTPFGITKRERMAVIRIVVGFLTFLGMVAFGILASNKFESDVENVLGSILVPFGFIMFIVSITCMAYGLFNVLRTPSSSESLDDASLSFAIGGLVYGAFAFVGIVSMMGSFPPLIQSISEFAAYALGL